MNNPSHENLRGISILAASLKMLQPDKNGDHKLYEEACDNIAQSLVSFGVQYDYDKFMAACGIKSETPA